MIGTFLVAGVLTVPYWWFQKVTNQPKARSNQRRWRLFSAAFGTFCALDLGFAAIIGLASTNPNKEGIAARTAALPAGFLITGFGSKKGWMRKHFKAFDERLYPLLPAEFTTPIYSYGSMTCVSGITCIERN